LVDSFVLLCKYTSFFLSISVFNWFATLVYALTIRELAIVKNSLVAIFVSVIWASLNWHVYLVKLNSSHAEADDWAASTNSVRFKSEKNWLENNCLIIFTISLYPKSRMFHRFRLTIIDMIFGTFSTTFKARRVFDAAAVTKTSSSLKPNRHSINLACIF
jgi:hypothetical protein